MGLKTLPEIDDALRRRIKFHGARGKVYMPRIPPLLHPRHIEREYARELIKSFTKLFDLIDDTLVARLPALLAQSAQELATQSFDRIDTADDELSIILSGVLVEFGRELSQDEIKRIAKSKGLSVSEFNLRQNNKVFKQVLAVDIFRHEPWLVEVLENFASENAALITTLSETHITQVRGIVTQGFRQGLSVRTVAQRIRERTGVTKKKAIFLARDQISKLNGQLSKQRQQDVGVTRYKWKDSNDERVRPTHRANDEEIFSWDKPPPETGHPGEDFQCRCYPEPVLEDLIA